MATIKTGDITIPTQILDPWISKVRDASIVASLSAATPQKFGKGEAFVVDTGEAEYVGEGEQKSSSGFTTKVQKTDPHKFQKTVRMSDEVKWASEDHQLEIIDEILAGIQPALSRALDWGVLHGINPMTGQRVDKITQYLAAAEASVEHAAGAKPFETLDAASALVLAGGNLPTGAGLDFSLAAKFSQARTEQGVKLYPNFNLSQPVSEIEGLRAAVSRTVKGVGVIGDSGSNILGFVGDFSAIRWGVQKSIGLKMIEYGDPDGNGDLQRTNEVAFRAEVVYGWGIADLGAFAKITEPAAG